jgi:hypothetical protein
MTALARTTCFPADARKSAGSTVCGGYGFAQFFNKHREWPVIRSIGATSSLSFSSPASIPGVERSNNFTRAFGCVWVKFWTIDSFNTATSIIN